MSSNNFGVETLIEIAEVIWQELTWFGRITIFLPLYILAISAVIFIVVLDKVEKIGMPKVIVDSGRNIGRLFIKRSDA